MKKLGFLDEQDCLKASMMGINLKGGYIRNTDGRVVIGNRFFLTMGMKYRYVLRSRIVWWLRTGEFLIGDEWDLHHKNENRVDDRFENLQKLSHREHSCEHNPLGLTAVTRICRRCNKEFQIPQWRLKEKGRGSYCSPNCYFRRKEKVAA